VDAKHLGGVIAFVATLGACGAGCEQRVVLIVYASLLILMILGAGAAAVYTYYKTSSVANFVGDAWGTIPTTQRSEIQENLHCCGLRKFNDSYSVQPCPAGLSARSGSSCLQKIIDDLTSHLNIVEYASIGIGAFMLLGISCSCSFLCSLRKARDKRKDREQERARNQSKASLLNPLLPKSDDGTIN